MHHSTVLPSCGPRYMLQGFPLKILWEFFYWGGLPMWVCCGWLLAWLLLDHTLWILAWLQGTRVSHEVAGFRSLVVLGLVLVHWWSESWSQKLLPTHCTIRARSSFSDGLLAGRAGSLESRCRDQDPRVCFRLLLEGSVPNTAEYGIWCVLKVGLV